MSGRKIMIKVLFVCHGNICRSAMAKFMFIDMISKQNLQNNFVVDSAAVSYEEEGNDLYPPAKEILQRHGIPFDRHRAHRMQKSDYDKFDFIIGMDESNLYNIMRILGEDPLNKVCKLLDFSPEPRDIADPWYTGNFERAYKDIAEGLTCLLGQVQKSFLNLSSNG